MVTDNVTFAPDLYQDCGDWREAQDVVYQVANLFFAVAFLVPDDVRFHVTLMRATLCLGCSCLVVSGGVAQCHVDVVVWYLVFLSVNVFHLVYALAECWPSAVLRPELRSLHAKVFAPLRVSRMELKELAELGSVKDLVPDEFYALQGETVIGERLSVLLSGRLKVRRGWIFLHSITSNQFVDSPEYLEFFAQSMQHDQGFVAASSPFQVSISAVESSRILTWNIGSLNRYLSSRPFMRVVIDGILGRDVTRKLSQVHEQLLTNPQYMCIVTDPSVTGGPSEPDEATSLQRRTVCRPNPTGCAAGGSGMRTEAWDVRPGPGGGDRTALRPRAIDLCPVVDKTRRSSGLAKTSNGNFPTTAGKGNASDSKTSSSQQHHKVETPIGPYSPSQVSFETFV